MKITFLAAANNYHTQKWCNYFVSKGYKVSVISFFPGTIDNVKVFYINCGMDAKKSDGKKIKYLLQAVKVKRIINRIKPDIISVHYASSYGAVAALARLKNYYLSVWGSDVYEFPEKSIFHRCLVKYSLNHACTLLSTSKAMAIHARKYTNKKFEITPFGVRTDVFTPQKRNRNDSTFVIGTVKALDPKYGIDYLIKAVAKFKINNPNVSFQLRIAGKGDYREEYERLADSLGIGEETVWLGFISQEDAAREWANMDVAVIPSTLESESFGVSALEAQACGTPVIISDIPGLMEATYPGKTSIVVKRKNVDELYEAITKLYYDSELREKLAHNGLIYVSNKYSYDKCFNHIENIFLSKLKKY